MTHTAQAYVDFMMFYSRHEGAWHLADAFWLAMFDLQQEKPGRKPKLSGAERARGEGPAGLQPANASASSGAAPPTRDWASVVPDLESLDINRLNMWLQQVSWHPDGPHTTSWLYPRQLRVNLTCRLAMYLMLQEPCQLGLE